MLFWSWRLRRMTFDLAVSFIGIVFLLVSLLTPATPNWFLWAIPFLALHAGQTGLRGFWLVLSLSALKAVSTLLQNLGASIPLLNFDATAPLLTWLHISDPHLISLLLSMIVALGLLIAIRIWREGVRRNELYRMVSAPLSSVLPATRARERTRWVSASRRFSESRLSPRSPATTITNGSALARCGAP